MNIKKVDDKPMVIHTKEKTKLHIKQEPETKIKGRNVLVVDKSPKIAGIDIVNIGLHFFLKNVRPYAASCSEA